MIGTKVLEEQNGRTTYTDKNSDDFAITYKGPLEDLSSLQSLEYSFSHSAGGVSTLEDYDRPPVEATFESIGGIKDGMKISRNEVIHVHVMWDDAEESFELRRASK
ncbi:hypothetical protein [Alteribacter aurantiacus]|uniref:hypothetical protein n=1 Tax=Alteribacter aurantiacus TaxID=254410 RepID=UPI0004115936|nr:hypothetical protein [Alteribacter aurantiacus]